MAEQEGWTALPVFHHRDPGAADVSFGSQSFLGQALLQADRLQFLDDGSGKRF